MQQIVLDLFTHLAQYSITAGELSLYLEFFKGEDPPVDSLISPLCQLMMSTKPQPHFIMCFPIEAESRQDHANKDLSANQKKPKSSNIFQYKQNASTTTNADNAAIAMIKKLHDEHILAGIWSVWALSALALPIDADIGWSPWTNGFSLSLWLRLGCPTSRSTPPISSSTSSPCLSLTSLSGSQSEWGLIGENIKENSPCPSINLLTDNFSAWSSVGSNSSLHLFSIGNELLTLEAWTNPTTDSLTLKLMRTDGKKMIILSESTVESCFSPLLWHHLAVNVKDFMQRRKSVIEVTLFIDGCKEIKVLMTFNGLLMRRAAPTCLLLGHVTNQTANSSWYFGNLALFRSPVFSKERAFYLMSMGPNFNHLTDCDVEKQHPNFSSVLTSSAINAGVDWDAVFEVNHGNLKLLQDHLLLSYSAQNSRFLNVYPAVVTNPGGLGVVGSLFPGQPGFRVVTVDQRASQQLPLGLQPIFLGGCPNLQMYQGLAAAVSSLGGTMVFMFLFAQIVQMGSTEDCQAKALLLLLELVHSDGDMFSQFVNEDSFQLLIKVLTSSLCKSGLHILKAILDSSCDKSVLHYQSPPGKFHIMTQSNAIITQPGLLLMVIQAWRGWENFHRIQDSKESSTTFDFVKNCIKCDNSSSNLDNLSVESSGGSFGMYLSVLLALLRDDHPYREFNAAQLNRVGTVEALLLFCKERFILEDSTSSLSSSVCCSLVEVIRLLMGAPPEFSHIVALSDFLVLVHQASATYITHARSSFYFLLTPNPYAPSKSQRTTPVSPGKC
ncbi:hypothetical protein J437_LFUL012841 [Ladona fulva]|uniref:Uncharacterized protein n=1 Tax=Ladona fulva TaxID=123851 RepID=A0A8K0P592_LADFU|nr:hypothetical protein J437_LFUL012841 [Ladona fulva]